VETSGENSLRLTLSSDGKYSDELLIVMDDKDATSAYDNNGGDFMKMFINLDTRSEIFCKTSDDFNVVINSLKPTTGTIAVPVYMKVGNTGSYTLTASENTYSSKTGVLLRDTKTNTTVDLKTTPNYTFTAASNDDPARFLITFSDVLNGIKNLSNNGFGIYSFETSIYVQNNTSRNIEGRVIIYDMIGKQILQENLGNDAITRINTTLNKGFYIVSVITADGSYTQKVYIN